MRTNLTPKLHIPACLALLSVLLTGCGGDSAETYVASAKKYLDKNDYHAAAIQLKNAVQKDPQNGEARRLLGLSLLKEGYAESAEIELRKAVEAGNPPEQVEPLLVKALVQQGKAQAVLDTVAGAKSKDPNVRAELEALAGEANLAMGRIDDARKVLQSALSLSADNRTARLGEAKLAAMESRFDDALKLTDRLLTTQANDAESLLLKADILQVGKRQDEAIAAYKAAIAADPSNAKGYLALIPMLLKAADVSTARTLVDQLKKASPRGSSGIYLDALVSYAERKLPAARELALAILKGAPQHVPSLLLAGSVELESGNYVQAEDHLSKVLQINPNAYEVRKTLVRVYLRSGDPERAQDELSKLIAQRPNDPTLFALRGEVAVAKGQLDEAAQDFQKAVAANPQDQRSRVRLGQAKFAAGEFQQGIEELEKAAADGSSGVADTSLASIYLSRKEVPKAMAAAERLIKKQPENPQAYAVRAAVYLAQKDEARARQDLEHALQLQPKFFPAARSLASLDMKKGDSASARRRFESILTLDAKNLQALLALAGLVAKSTPDSPEVMTFIDRAIEGNPKSPAARLAKVRYLSAKGDKKAALAAAQQAVAVMPESPAVLEALGRVQLANGDSNQALATFGKLATLLPKSVVPLAGQAEAYVAAKDWEGARRVLNKALQLDKNAAGVKKALVQTSLLANEHERALKEIHDLQKQAPEQLDNYLAEARVLVGQKRTAEAEKVLRDFQAKKPTAQSTVALLSFLNSQGKEADAEALASQWMKQHPGDVDVPVAQGQARMTTKDYAGSARWWRVALKAKPDSALLLNNLAWTLNQLKDPSAVEVAERAVALAPNSAVILDTLGWIRVERGELDKGIEQLSRSHQMAPNNAAIRLNLAKALMKAGRKGEAKPHLDALMKLPAEAPLRKEAQSLLAQG